MWYLLKKIMSWGEDNPSSLPLRKHSCDLQYVCCHSSCAGGPYMPHAFSIMAFWRAVSVEPALSSTSHRIPTLMTLGLKRFCMSFGSFAYR